jgi:hypothetical protein
VRSSTSRTVSHHSAAPTPATWSAPSVVTGSQSKVASSVRCGGRDELEQGGQAAGYAGGFRGPQPDPGPVDSQQVALVASRPGRVQAQRRGQPVQVRVVAEADHNRVPAVAWAWAFA